MVKKDSGKKTPEPMGGTTGVDGTSTEAVTRRPRIAGAILTLVAEIEKMFPGVQSDVGNYSTFNVATDVWFDASSDPEVAELLALTAGDARIENVTEDEGQVLVEFYASLRTQDDRAPFGLKDALAVLRGAS